MKSETVSLVRRWMVSMLIVVLALLDPVGVGVFAQQRGTTPVPRSPKLPPGIFQSAPDPVLDPVVADLVAIHKDILVHGVRGSHQRRQALGLRLAATHLATQPFNAQVMAWANTADANELQFRAFDPQIVETATAWFHQQGLSADVIQAAVNSSPEQRRQVLELLRTQGPSGMLLQAAEALEEAIQKPEPQASVVDGNAVVRFVRPPDCDRFATLGTYLGYASLIYFFIPGPGTTVSMIFAFEGSAASLYAQWDCPGLGLFCSGAGTVKEGAVWKL